MHRLLVFLLAFAALAAHAAPTGKTCVVDSFEVSKILADCSTSTINTRSLDGLKDNAIVDFAGDLLFDYSEREGPLFRVSGASDTAKVTADKLYWDGKGSNGGKTKPHLVVKLNAAGSVSLLGVKNTPTHAISVGAKGEMLLDRITIDDSLGANNGGHNTGCFDVLNVNGLTIQNSICKNQDDWLALNDGKNVKFLTNQCIGGHGILIGSIKAGKHVDNVLIQGNTIADSDQALHRHQHHQVVTRGMHWCWPGLRTVLLNQ
ncbi:hypothetical protein AMAG_16353 [Allomyces macrogynus ATCC 38327]|uniref:Right handed beta helix domain-containing protein n=1 Tax=Allomyces macrogynus (strain ATCC 38327) TaxID=578462 RepID=A0A0L0TBI0_ALLM3|nr:hypothetical protein AMAG_16353 [Allomyces macrogynus ATCC 38327]|eukprot:KNE71929.1 hypothetical protein AMAG_16353 [Allomyces macrogynus ATCC 38327]